MLFFLLPLAAGLLLRTSSLGRYLADNPFSAHLFSDAHHYLEWARRIAAGESPREVFYQAPLYPYLLAVVLRVFGESLAILYAAQLLLGVVSILLLTLIGRIFLPSWAAATAAALFALLPYPAYFELKLFPETTATALSLLTLYLALRLATGVAGVVAAGAAAGAASLARAAFLPVGVLFFLHQLRSGRRGALLFAASFSLVLSPAIVHNYRFGGGLVPIAANAGEVFAHGNNSHSRGAMGKIPGLRADIETLAQESREVASRGERRPLSAAEASGFWFREGLGWIRSDPGGYVRLEARKLRLLLSARFVPLSSFFDFEAGRFPTVPRRLYLLHYPLLLFAGIGLLRPRARRSIPFPLAAYACLQAVVPLLFFVSTRYTAPLLPALALMAGSGLAYGLDRRGRLLLMLLTPLVLLLAIADARAMSEHATPFAQLASIRSSEGRASEALELYEEAVRINPLELIHHQNLARERENLGDYAGACEAIERAVRAGLADARTLGYYGSLLAALGRDEEAEGVFREAIRMEPALSRAHYELGRLLARLGRTNEAKQELQEAARLSPNDPAPNDALRALAEASLEAK